MSNIVSLQRADENADAFRRLANIHDDIFTPAGHPGPLIQDRDKLKTYDAAVALQRAVIERRGLQEMLRGQVRMAADNSDIFDILRVET